MLEHIYHSIRDIVLHAYIKLKLTRGNNYIFWYVLKWLCHSTPQACFSLNLPPQTQNCRDKDHKYCFMFKASIILTSVSFVYRLCNHNYKLPTQLVRNWKTKKYVNVQLSPKNLNILCIFFFRNGTCVLCVMTCMRSWTHITV